MPTHRVLDCYTDEHITAELAREDRAESWKAAQRELLKVPADWRQSIVAHAMSLTTITTTVYKPSGLAEGRHQSVGSTNAMVIAAVQDFLTGWRPSYRTEEPIEGTEAGTP